MKENRKKAPPGWKIRVGQLVGHGTFIGHFTMPSGFYFTRDMHQCHLRPGETFRDMVVSEAWGMVDADSRYKLEKANERANAEDDWEFHQAIKKGAM